MKAELFQSFTSSEKTMTFLLWYVHEASKQSGPGPAWLQLCSTQLSQPLL